MHRNKYTPFGANATGLPVASLPLFAWAAACPATLHPDHLPRPVRALARRYGLSPLRARVVAELAGFNMEICDA